MAAGRGGDGGKGQGAIRGGVAAAVLAAAARAVAAVTPGGRSADDALAGASGEQRAAIRAVTLGTLRHYLRLQPALRPLLANAGGRAELLALLAAPQLLSIRAIRARIRSRRRMRRACAPAPRAW
jgi:hypothetical protein